MPLSFVPIGFPVYAGAMGAIALSDLLGLPVYDSESGRVGRVREVALLPQDDPIHIAALIVRTPQGDRIVGTNLLRTVNGGVHTAAHASDLPKYSSGEGMLLLERDLLDQQIIDVHGRKVVRVNDIELALDREAADSPLGLQLRIAFVDAGARGAVRRLLKGMVPRYALSNWLERIPARNIPWEFVNLIETDPARRVRLKISSDSGRRASIPPTSPISSKSSRPPIATPSSRPSMRTSPHTRWRRSIPSSRSPFSTPWSPNAPPTSSRK